ncbi:Pantoate-beta-alanine ligase [Metschnikowia bicuspidata]|uniref:Pantoate--beta-alanine ligase n=1 Tax=Metschnikowia bicuspidata TaxID=27322 RepID=A0A4P9Z9P6_9ASCO|nr:Pantoate-beta-alanine ligase [Metschnikowia bicuspidata]
MAAATKIIRSVLQMRSWRRQCLVENQSVGFVPTMGALHMGHCHLVKSSLAENDKTVVSIFVNPSQFAPHEDLDAYPRTLDRDWRMLKTMFPDKPVDAVYVPETSEMYPSGILLNVSEQKGAFVTVFGCSEGLEGTQRPAFFRGVATVVTKLLNVVLPDRVYFGQKDAQQCVVVKNLVKDLLIDTEVRILETFRESNGLAMLSRNAYLSPEVLDQAAIIYRGLCAGREVYATHVVSARSVSARLITDVVRNVYSNMPLLWEVEYVAVSHPDTLEDLEGVDFAVGGLVSTAVRVPRGDGGIARLIDNVPLAPQTHA